MTLKKDMFKDDDNIVPSISNELISDPVKDFKNNELPKKADIITVHGEISSNSNLDMFLETKDNIENKPTYHLYLVIFRKSAVSHIDVAVNNGVVVSSSLEGVVISGIRGSVNGHVIHLVIPNKIYKGYTSMLLNASTSIGRRVIDTTALKTMRP